MSLMTHDDIPELESLILKYTLDIGKEERRDMGTYGKQRLQICSQCR